MYEINGVPIDRVHDVMGALVELKDSADPAKADLDLIIGRAIETRDTHRDAGRISHARAWGEVIMGAQEKSNSLYHP